MYAFMHLRVLHERKTPSFEVFLLGIRRWNEYVEHGDDTDVDAALKRSSRNLEEELEVLEIGEGILTRNLGLDVIVVVTKVCN